MGSSYGPFVIWIWYCLISFICTSFLQIYIGNLDPNVTEEELRQHCLPFGEIGYVKIPASKGCGFVQFAARYLHLWPFEVTILL